MRRHTRLLTITFTMSCISCICVCVYVFVRRYLYVSVCIWIPNRTHVWLSLGKESPYRPPKPDDFPSILTTYLSRCVYVWMCLNCVFIFEGRSHAFRLRILRLVFVHGWCQFCPNNIEAYYFMRRALIYVFLCIVLPAAVPLYRFTALKLKIKII